MRPRSQETLLAALLSVSLLAAPPLFALDVVTLPELGPTAQPTQPSPVRDAASIQAPLLGGAVSNVSLSVPALELPASALTAAAPAQATSVIAATSRAETARGALTLAQAAPRVAAVVRDLTKRAVSAGEALFDGPSAFAFGIMRPESHPSLELPEGVRVTRKPRPLQGRGGPVTLARFHLAPDHSLEDGSRPIVLNADPSDMASVEHALRAVVDADPAEYGAESRDMAAVHVEKLPGKGNQADSIIAVFRQVKKGVDIGGKPYYLAVEGGNLRFHVKVLNGKPVVMGVEGGFAPNVDPSVMTVRFTDEQLNDIALSQIRGDASGEARDVSQERPQLSLLTRQITFIDKAWRAANVYQGNDLKGSPVIVIVDVKSGKPYVVNADDLRYRSFPGRRSSMTTRPESQRPPPAEGGSAPGSRLESFAQEESGAPISGVVVARAPALTSDGQDHGPTRAKPLINAYVYDDAGHVVATTDAQGRFTIPASVNGGAPIKVTVKLSGVYGDVFDEDSKDAPLAVSVTARPGEPVTITINPEGDDEQLGADVNGYLYPYGMIEWLKSTLGLGDDARFFKPLKNGIHANGTQMAANAFYDPVSDAFFLMKSASIKVPVGARSRSSATITRVSRAGTRRTITLVAENTAQPSIELHEFGHRQFQVASQLRLTDEQAADPAYRFVKWLLDPVVGSDANEAGADTFSMFIRNSPIIGNGFFVSATPASALPSPDIIRTGDNTTAYEVPEGQQADPHALGETQMGTAWKTRADLIREMGPVEGSLYAALLFVRTWLYAQPGSVPSALMHALLADMQKDGTIPHAELILGHARDDHNLNLPSPPVPAGA